MVEVIFDNLDEACKNDAVTQAAEDPCNSAADSLTSGFQLSQGNASRAARFSCDYNAQQFSMRWRLLHKMEIILSTSSRKREYIGRTVAV